MSEYIVLKILQKVLQDTIFYENIFQMVVASTHLFASEGAKVSRHPVFILAQNYQTNVHFESKNFVTTICN